MGRKIEEVRRQKALKPSGPPSFEQGRPRSSGSRARALAKRGAGGSPGFQQHAATERRLAAQAGKGSVLRTLAKRYGLLGLGTMVYDMTDMNIRMQQEKDLERKYLKGILAGPHGEI